MRIGLAIISGGTAVVRLGKAGEAASRIAQSLLPLHRLKGKGKQQ